MIAAGGTAGHVVPALAVADALRAEGAEVVFVGGERAERELVPGGRLRVAHDPRCEPLPRGRPLPAAAVPPSSTRPRVAAAWRLVGELRPDAALGAGGYVAGPVGLAAVLRRVPLVLIEADSHLGLTNRLLAPFARSVCLSFPIVWAQRRGATASPGARYRRWPRTAEPPAGASGSGRETPACWCSAALRGRGRSTTPRSRRSRGPASGCLHAAGERDLAELAVARGRTTTCAATSRSFGDALLASDLVVARAGGSIFEIAAYGRPAVLVPYPYATADHQSENAGFMERAGAAIVIPDTELTGPRLAQEVGRLLADRSRLSAMARASAELARPEAAREIAGELLAASESRRRRPRTGRR